MPIVIKRIYEKPAAGDGARILVDRVWPRGLKREDLKLDLWLKDAGPSDKLRKWFGHDPGRWKEFRQRYIRELEANPDPVMTIREHMEQGKVTLLFGARDEEHNQARVLKEYLEATA